MNWRELAVWCRSMSTMLEGGVEILKAIKTSAKKSSSLRTRRACQYLEEQVTAGTEINLAMRKKPNWFPTLLIDLVTVGEKTGHLPEVLKSMSAHYENLVRLKNEFVSSITWPIIQYFLAMGIIGGVIYLLGLITATNGAEATDPLGWGLTGEKGAIRWFTINFAIIFAVVILYYVINKLLAGKQFVDMLLLRVPVVGRCMQSLAIARFSWSFYLTQSSGIDIIESLKASLKATSNGAYEAAIPRITDKIVNGGTLSEAMRESSLFPDEFLEMVSVGETSGTVPETLHRLSPQFEEEARRSMTTLTNMLNVLIRVMVGGFIIFLIFSLALKYIGTINSFTDSPLGNPGE